MELENTKERHHMKAWEYIGDVRVWTVFISLRIRTSGELL
jgi:hypothetical protein